MSPEKQKAHPHAGGLLGGWSGAAGGPVSFCFCFLDFFVPLHLPWPSLRGCSVLQPVRHPFLLRRLWGETKEQVQWVRAGTERWFLKSSSENWAMASDLCLLPWPEREPGWRERGVGQREQSEFWSGRCRTSCKICKQLLQAISLGLIMGQALFQGFPPTSSFQTHNNMRRWVQSIPPFYRWANWGYGRLSNRPKVTQHILEALGLGPRAHITTVLDWQMESGTFFFFF